MNDKRYRYILYTIVLVILATIGLQVYWNYKNYLLNKQQLINDVQVSLDKAVDDYYTNLAERTTLGITLEGDQQKMAFGEDDRLENFLKKVDYSNKQFTNLDALNIDDIEGIEVFKGIKADSMMAAKIETKKAISADSFKLEIDKLKTKADTSKFKNIELLTSKIVISINNDSLKIKEVDSILKLDLLRKNITIDYDLNFNISKSNLKITYNNREVKDIVEPKDAKKLKVYSESAFLPKGSALEMNFTNVSSSIFKRIIGGILISFLLVLAVISSLFYLLYIIKSQKQLAEVKNDLISNITHEFKTPIATISVALESLQNFEALNDKNKAKSYIDMSNKQLGKLHIMVEKLLETATLDKDSLEINKKDADLAKILKSCIIKHQMTSPHKTFTHTNLEEPIMVSIDIFHMENALNNIIDNAVKYGGENIHAHITKNKNDIVIAISDDGNQLSENDQNHIFEKFYRIPRGNTHDIKGFGIGLYYTKKIIEKHGGTIEVVFNKKAPTFKITLIHE